MRVGEANCPRRSGKPPPAAGWIRNSKHRNPHRQQQPPDSKAQCVCNPLAAPLKGGKLFNSCQPISRQPISSQKMPELKRHGKKTENDNLNHCFDAEQLISPPLNADSPLNPPPPGVVTIGHQTSRPMGLITSRTKGTPGPALD